MKLTGLILQTIILVAEKSLILRASFHPPTFQLLINCYYVDVWVDPSIYLKSSSPETVPMTDLILWTGGFDSTKHVLSACSPKGYKGLEELGGFATTEITFKPSDSGKAIGWLRNNGYNVFSKAN